MERQNETKWSIQKYTITPKRKLNPNLVLRIVSEMCSQKKLHICEACSNATPPHGKIIASHVRVCKSADRIEESIFLHQVLFNM